MRGRLMAVLLLLTATFAACSSSDSNSRTVEIDGASDEFAGSFWQYFPRDVTVRPGMTVKFHQTWTGAAHTVTMGSTVQNLVTPPLLQAIKATPEREFTSESPSDEVLGGLEAFMGGLPFFYGEKGPSPSAAQPCYLRRGLPQEGKACARRTQPAFDGNFSYYNSGFIPYLGDGGNTYAIRIAEDTKPGSYFYYCNLHGAQMSGEIHVTRDESIPSQAEVNRQGQAAKTEIERHRAADLRADRAGKGEFKGNLSGSGRSEYDGYLAEVDEFTPRTVQAHVGEPVKWTFIGNHTISFNVPPYFPLLHIAPSGRVVENARAFATAGGWPGRPEPVNFEGPPGPSVDVDAGTWSGGGGLKSSGEGWQAGDTYTITFAKRGTYPMACLIHPGMIGKVVVT